MVHTEEQIDRGFNNDFELQLKEAGYKWFKDNLKNSLRGFQKKVIDEKGIRYFITGYHYNHGKTFPDRAPDMDTYGFDCQFRIDKTGKDQVVSVYFLADFLPNEFRPVTTLQEAEEFYEKMFIATGADYYEEYGD